MIPEMNPPSSAVFPALSSVRLPLDLRSVCYTAMVLPEFCFPGFSYYLSNCSIFLDLLLFFKIRLIFSKDKMKTQYFLRILSLCVETSLHLPSYFPSQNHALRLLPPGITSLCSQPCHKPFLPAGLCQALASAVVLVKSTLTCLL